MAEMTRVEELERTFALAFRRGNAPVHRQWAVFRADDGAVVLTVPVQQARVAVHHFGQEVARVPLGDFIDDIDGTFRVSCAPRTIAELCERLAGFCRVERVSLEVAIEVGANADTLATLQERAWCDPRLSRCQIARNAIARTIDVSL